MATGHFQPGTSGNPNGRPLGSRNRRTEEAILQLLAAGHQSPLLTLNELQATSEDEGIRVTAANSLAQFMFSKMGAMQPLRFIPEPVTLPHPNPTIIDHVNANIAHINQLYAAQILDAESTALMLAGQREHTVSFKAREEVPSNQDIKITGGLPELPGTNITMPQLNGHETLSLVAPNDPPITPPEDVDLPPAIPEQDEGIQS
jgi:hypothetical protein